MQDVLQDVLWVVITVAFFAGQRADACVSVLRAIAPREILTVGAEHKSSKRKTSK
jgi:hypothetical protein